MIHLVHRQAYSPAVRFPLQALLGLRAATSSASSRAADSRTGAVSICLLSLVQAARLSLRRCRNNRASRSAAVMLLHGDAGISTSLTASVVSIR